MKTFHLTPLNTLPQRAQGLRKASFGLAVESPEVEGVGGTHFKSASRAMMWGWGRQGRSVPCTL